MKVERENGKVYRKDHEVKFFNLAGQALLPGSLHELLLVRHVLFGANNMLCDIKLVKVVHWDRRNR